MQCIITLQTDSGLEKYPISRISNSVTHPLSFTNTAIADITTLRANIVKPRADIVKPGADIAGQSADIEFSLVLV